ncbi:hypothetical protein ElyMa_003219500 [Elysia marginata]|uniref:Uncharacterized protein n=1 Tax=Elysia marginata TaxID=1093978 RepID=A0AAV4J1K0_9GAST|nr:hypothetical protein ElyMa_003219500 [Elysia marginata]
MALKSRTFAYLGIVFCIACLIALVISFASDKWIISTETEVVGFKNLGLWSVCFDQYRPPPYVFVDRLYEGCWWVLDKELELLQDFLFPVQGQDIAGDFPGLRSPTWSHRYAYSPAKFPPHPQSTTAERKPAYANRYHINNGRATSGRGSESSLVEPRPPDTLFAVSGAGELYVNRLADYDEERTDGGLGRAGERQYGRAGGTYTNHQQPVRNANGTYSTRNQNGDAANARQRPGATQTSVSNGNQERSKPAEHPVLPEYVKKPAKPSEDELDESDDDVPEKPGLDSSDSDHSGHKGRGTKKKSSSTSKSKDRSSTGKSRKDNNKKTKNSSKDSDYEDKHRHRSSSKKKSKKSDKHQDSDEESTHRGRRHSSSKSKSKHRSRSRDLNTSRDSYDSNASGGHGRSGSRSRRRSRSRSRDRGLEDDRRSRKRSGSREGRSTKKGKGVSSTKSDYWSDDMSEASTKRKGKTAEAKARARDYSDGESMRGRNTVKSTRPSQGGERKPKGTYSSYYEY